MTDIDHYFIIFYQFSFHLLGLSSKNAHNVYSRCISYFLLCFKIPRKLFPRFVPSTVYGIYY